MISIDAAATLAIILDFVGSLANNVITGLGAVIALVTSQSAFLNTPSPIVQSLVGTLQTIIFSFANFMSFSNLIGGNWAGSPPANVEDAINRMATTVAALNGGPIP